MYFIFILNILATGISLANAHGAVTEVRGANGITSTGIGIITTTPRDGSGRNPFQRDTSIIRDREIASGRTGVCGRTIAEGNNDVAASMAEKSAAGLPSLAEDGTITMTLHQVNQDGGGPYECDISSDGSGNDFQPMVVTTNVPGIRGFSRATAQDFPLVAQAPPGTVCTGGPNGDACLVRCRNNTPAGPFGSCATVTNPESGEVSSDISPATADRPGIASAFGAGGNGRGGFLSRLFGSSKRDILEKKRVVGSRIIERGLAGKWL